MATYPDVNGVRVSYCSIELDIDGTKLKGVRSINYKETTEIPKIRGLSAKPIGRTRGNSDFEGDIELYREEWDELVAKLSQNGAVGFSETSWPVSITYAEPSDLSKTVTDRLIGVRFHSPEIANSESADATVVKVMLSIMDIAWNGRGSLRVRA